MIATILREAREESDRLDREVCGMSHQRSKVSQQKLDDAQRASNVDAYSQQVVLTELEGYQPPPEGFAYSVNEAQQYKFEQAFCSLFSKVPMLDDNDKPIPGRFVMSLDDFDTDNGFDE